MEVQKLSVTELFTLSVETKLLVNDEPRPKYKVHLDINYILFSPTVQ